MTPNDMTKLLRRAKWCAEHRSYRYDRRVLYGVYQVMQVAGFKDNSSQARLYVDDMGCPCCVMIVHEAAQRGEFCQETIH